MIICTYLNNCCKKLGFFQKRSNSIDIAKEIERGKSIKLFQKMSQSDLEKVPGWDQSRKSSIFGGNPPRSFQVEKRHSAKLKRKQTGWVKGANPLSTVYSVDDDDEEDDDIPTNKWKKSEKSSNVYAESISDKNERKSIPFDKWKNGKEQQIYSVTVLNVNEGKLNKDSQAYLESVSNKTTRDVSSSVSGKPKPLTSSNLKYVIFIPTAKRRRKSNKQNK